MPKATLPSKTIKYRFVRGENRRFDSATKKTPKWEFNMPKAGVEPARGVNHTRF